MGSSRSAVWACVALVGAATGTQVRGADGKAVADGTPVIDGKPNGVVASTSLDGFTSTTPAYWSIEDGAIVGQSKEPVPHNEFLWCPVEVSDFYLAVDIKLDPNQANAGIQFRSQKLPPFEALGYQADAGKDVWGRLYHESGRKKLYWGDRGEKAVKPGEWNHYEILAVGDRIWTAINGQLAVAVKDPAGERKGFVAFQMHAGGPMSVRYKVVAFHASPKVVLAGMDEAKLNAALVPPDVDPAASKAGKKKKAVPAKGPEKSGEKAAGDRPGSHTWLVNAEAAPATRTKAAPPTGRGLNHGAPLPEGVVSEQRFGQKPTGAKPAAAFPGGRFVLQNDEGVVFAGQTNTVRQQQSGVLEALLATRFAAEKPRFRSMAWEGDTVYGQWRDLNFGGWADQLAWARATAVIAWFGQTEALDGPDRLAAFAQAYGRLIDQWSAVTRRVVLVSPLPFEKPPADAGILGGAGLPDHSAENATAHRYAQAIETLAHDRGLIYVNLFDAIESAKDRPPLTADGIHLTPAGQDWVGRQIAMRLLGGKSVESTSLSSQDSTGHEVAARDTPELRAAIVEKNRLWFDNWRPMNWAFAYGDRTQVPFGQAISDHPPLRVEFEDFKPLIRHADDTIHELAASNR